MFREKGIKTFNSHLLRGNSKYKTKILYSNLFTSGKESRIFNRNENLLMSRTPSAIFPHFHLLLLGYQDENAAASVHYSTNFHIWDTVNLE